jgi:hypothetical protein
MILFSWLNIIPLKELAMKVKKLVEKLNKAEVEYKLDKAKKFWFKLLKKSLKHKHTEAVK